jgi:hypothetical protein
MPVLGQVLSGNSSDKAWNFETLETLSRQLDAADIEKLVYIGDAQMVTGPNLDRIADLNWRFISRLPSMYALADEVKAAAFAEGEWLEVGRISPGKQAAPYRVQERSGVIDDRPYRLVVTQSSSLERPRSRRFRAASTRRARPSCSRPPPGTRSRSPVRRTLRRRQQLSRPRCPASGGSRPRSGPRRFCSSAPSAADHARARSPRG